ncbi:hypothetical protein OSB04_002745 [Centaurea solstitialis]|uniref:Uncharacterized protein n=1 Tax=Centaurea solstitialis TaxID=347529 RepID=A0AA38WUZ4_9ASTR|nr:hypothetical protein OSB04_002745 [Centaurea solstitialis]
MRWIEEIEMVFETCRCSDEDKVVFAWSMLKADALHWWIGMQTGRGIPATRGDPTRTERIIPALVGNGSGMELDILTRSGDGSGTDIMEPKTFQAAINAAEMIAREKDIQMKERRGGGERKRWDGPVSDPRKGKFPRVEMRGGQNPRVRPCGKCHHVHRGNCQMGLVTCFQCGLPGNLSRDYTSNGSYF